jgi:hypothetical protein
VPAGAAKGSRLNSVVALSKSDAWAVGDGSKSPDFLHWNGHVWAQVKSAPIPDVDTIAMLGVAGRSPNDVWAVGQAENSTTQHERPVIEHWNGQRWTLMASPKLGNFSFLDAVTVASDGSAWAAGSSDGQSGPFILRWTGRSWVKAVVPKTPSNVDIDLQGITSVSPKQIWAVGEISTSNTPSRPYSIRWNGHSWQSVKMPDPGPTSQTTKLLSVAAFGHGQLAAVGYTDGAQVSAAVFASWNGHSWTTSRGSDSQAMQNDVATDGHSLWAVGSRDVSLSRFVPLIQTSH